LAFSLKGWDNLAQGNALGLRANNYMHPEGVRQLEAARGLLSQPFRLDCQTAIKTRALPWARLSQPFRLKTNATHSSLIEIGAEMMGVFFSDSHDIIGLLERHVMGNFEATLEILL
jgi:hypothetical protein